MSSSRIGRFVARAISAALCLSVLGLAAGSTLAVSSASAVGYPPGKLADPAVDWAIASLDSLNSGDIAAFRTDITELADEVAWRAGIEPGRLVDAWLAANPESVTVVLSALSQLGVSYRYASSSPGVAFDCSGLVRWAWSQAGIDLPSNSTAIIRSKSNTPVDELEPGDVLWYPGHVMIALGVDDAYVHAVGRGKVLEVNSMRGRHANRLRAIDPLG